VFWNKKKEPVKIPVYKCNFTYTINDYGYVYEAFYSQINKPISDENLFNAISKVDAHKRIGKRAIDLVDKISIIEILSSEITCEYIE